MFIIIYSKFLTFEWIIYKLNNFCIKSSLKYKLAVQLFDVPITVNHISNKNAITIACIIT